LFLERLSLNDLSCWKVLKRGVCKATKAQLWCFHIEVLKQECKCILADTRSPHKKGVYKEMVTATIVKTFSGIEMGQDRLSNKNNLLADMEGFRAATLNYAMKASQSGLVLRTEI
jgi:hypothetical protein